MRFTETELAGAFLVDLEPRRDQRGFFARTFDAAEFEAHGLNPVVAQCSLAFNSERGTLRGMHYQVAPATETKLVRCTRGAIHDVIVDMRPESPTYLHHVGVDLAAGDRTSLYVPEMLAHGYQSLVDETEVSYQMGEPYAPGHGRGLLHDDPALGIDWPLPVSVISDRDRSWPALSAVAEASP